MRADRSAHHEKGAFGHTVAVAINDDCLEEPVIRPGDTHEESCRGKSLASQAAGIDLTR